jgi:predicted GH43/DUF377 family glycosyl hydrolase
MQTTHRFFHAYSDVLFPVRREIRGVPSVYRQAEELGGKFTRIVNGLPENSIANFNPSVIKHNQNTYIAWRCQPQPFGFRHDMKYFYLNGQPNDIYIGMLGPDDASIIGTKKLRPKKHRLSYEDPRLFKGPDESLYVQFITSTYASRYDKRTDKLFHQPKVSVCWPLFTGSLEDRVIEWTDLMGNPVSNQPAVILPFGAYVESTELVMSLGVNDAFMGIFRTPLENIMKRLKKVD